MIVSAAWLPWGTGMEPDDCIEDHDDDIPDFRDPERLEPADQEPQLTTIRSGGGTPMIANPIPWPDGAHCAVAMTWDMDADSAFNWY